MAFWEFSDLGTWDFPMAETKTITTNHKLWSGWPVLHYCGNAPWQIESLLPHTGIAGVRTQALTGTSIASSCWARLWTGIGGVKSCMNQLTPTAVEDYNSICDSVSTRDRHWAASASSFSPARWTLEKSRIHDKDLPCTFWYMLVTAVTLWHDQSAPGLPSLSQAARTPWPPPWPPWRLRPPAAPGARLRPVQLELLVTTGDHWWPLERPKKLQNMVESCRINEDWLVELGSTSWWDVNVRKYLKQSSPTIQIQKSFSLGQAAKLSLSSVSCAMCSRTASSKASCTLDLSGQRKK